MTVECIGFKSIGKGALQGYANLWVPKMGLEIYGCALYMKNGRRWLNLPQREYEDTETGETKYIGVIRFREKEHYDAFQEVAKDAIDSWCAQNSGQ